MMAINQDSIKVHRLWNLVKDFLDDKTRSLLSWMLTPDEAPDLAEYQALVLDVDDESVASNIRAIQMAYVDQMGLGKMHEVAMKKWNQSQNQKQK
jgi:Trp operon repressor